MPSFNEQTGFDNPFDSIDVGFSSSPVFADIDGDGDLDMLVGERYGEVFYFENTGSTTSPSYIEQSGTNNPFDGIEVVMESAPTFADIDGDNDLDLIIGDDNGGARYFENTGSVTNPSYIEVTGTNNPVVAIDLNGENTITFADIDSDGDLDAISGQMAGNLRYFENTGSATSPSYTEIAGANNPFNGIDVGNESDPTFADIDGDGDLDLLVGASNGEVFYFENTGSASSPSYAAQTGTNNPFDGIDVGDESAPTFADIDGDGDLDLVIGEDNGVINFFEQEEVTNNPPVAEAATNSATEGGPVIMGNVTSTDPDPGATATYALTGTAPEGLTFNTDGTYSFDPTDVAYQFLAQNETTDVVATFEVTDDQGATSTNTLTITVTGVGGAIRTGTSDDDVIDGSRFDDVIEGLDGNDNLSGRIGNDLLLGGNNNDTLLGQGGNDTLFGGDGVDSLFGGVGSDSLNGDAGNDSLSGQGGNDTVLGGSGDDTLIGAAGSDLLQGGVGNDSLSGGGNNDTLTGQGGDDTLLGGSGLDSLSGSSGDDLLQGGLGNDTLNGGNDNDILQGQGGFDLLIGASGDDVLVGGSSDDTLTGGNGSDIFRFDINFNNLGVDTLTDVASDDVLELSQSVFGLTGAIGDAIDSNEFASVTSLAEAESSGAAIAYNSNDGSLYFNANGAAAGFGDGGQFAQLDNSFDLQADQIELIA